MTADDPAEYFFDDGGYGSDSDVPLPIPPVDRTDEATELRREAEAIREALSACDPEDAECYAGHVADLGDVQAELRRLA